MSELKGKTILIVDDEPDLASVVEDILFPTGAEILIAYDGREAVTIINSRKQIDCIISDAQMPNMDGIELLEYVVKNKPEISFCLVSGYMRKTETEILHMGAKAYLSKPFSADRVLSVVKKILLTPTVPASTIKPAVYPPPAQPTPLAYILDDDPLDHDLLRRAFLQQDFGSAIKLEFFMLGEKLLDALRAGTAVPDLIVLDINLPGISGIDTLATIRRENLVGDKTRIIILSSSTSDSDQHRAKALSVDCLYRKPIGASAWWHLARAIYQSWLIKDNLTE